MQLPTKCTSNNEDRCSSSGAVCTAPSERIVFTHESLKPQCSTPSHEWLGNEFSLPILFLLLLLLLPTMHHALKQHGAIRIRGAEQPNMQRNLSYDVCAKMGTLNSASTSEISSINSGSEGVQMNIWMSCIGDPRCNVFLPFRAGHHHVGRTLFKNCQSSLRGCIHLTPLFLGLQFISLGEWNVNIRVVKMLAC